MMTETSKKLLKALGAKPFYGIFICENMKCTSLKNSIQQLSNLKNEKKALSHYDDFRLWGARKTEGKFNKPRLQKNNIDKNISMEILSEEFEPVALLN